MLIEIPDNAWIDPTTVIRIAVWQAYTYAERGSYVVAITSRGDLTTVVRFHTEEDAVIWSKAFAAQCNAFSLTQHDNTEWRLTLQKITDNG
jgi:hypothetical protein